MQVQAHHEGDLWGKSLQSLAIRECMINGGDGWLQVWLHVGLAQDHGRALMASFADREDGPHSAYAPSLEAGVGAQIYTIIP